MYYFERWFRAADDSTRKAVQALVTNGQLEFTSAGWRGPSHEGVTIDDLLADFASSQRWIFDVFGYRCPTAYIPPQHAISNQALHLLKEGGVEFAVIDGVDDSHLTTLRQTKSVEFLWETNAFYAAESRLLVHLVGDETSQQPLWEALSSLRTTGDASRVNELLLEELQSLQTEGRVLFLWPLDEANENRSWDALDDIVNKLAEDGQANILGTYAEII